MYFVSYSRKDSEFVLRLVTDLRRAGADLWLDQLDITGGQLWDDEIEAALESCAGVLAVLSPEALGSRNFKDEISFALEEDKAIVPVVYRSCKVPFRLRRLQRVDFSETYESGFDDLLRALGLEAPEPSDPGPINPLESDPVVAGEDTEPSPAWDETLSIPTSDIPAPVAAREDPAVSESKPEPYGSKIAAGLLVAVLLAWGVWQFGGSSTPEKPEPVSDPVELVGSDAKGEDPNALVLKDPSCKPTEWTDERGIEWISVCAGTFTMGAPADEPGTNDRERPQRRVTLPAFSMMKYEVTHKQYKELDPDHKSKWDGKGHKTAQWPVTNVTWQQSVSFCQSIDGRLPTEAEWEYAARAGTTTPWSFGSDEGLLKDYAVFGLGLSGEPENVGSKKPNPWGFHDIHGNVLEWVQDWYGSYPGTAEASPVRPDGGKYRILRGGSYWNVSQLLRSACRVSVWPVGGTESGGFRCARGPASIPFVIQIDPLT